MRLRLPSQIRPIRMASTAIAVAAATATSLTAAGTSGSPAGASPSYYLPWTNGAGFTITQAPGGSTSHNGTATRYHIDFGMPTGTVVRTSAPGRVAASRYESGYGNVVFVDHGGDECTVYGHLSSRSVSAGQQVGPAQQLGLSGSTGNSTGPHLHFGKVRCSNLYAATPISTVETGGTFTVGSRPVSRNTGQGALGTLADGTFVHATDSGHVFRMAGGVPIYISSWAPFGGPKSTVATTQAAVNGLGLPRNNTFIVGAETGQVYRIAGGAPIYIADWTPFGGAQPTVSVSQWSIDNAGNPLSHLATVPGDGTFVHGVETGRVYRIAGGAPIYINNWAHLGGSAPTVAVSQWSIDVASGSTHTHLRSYPSNGTFIHGAETGRVYRVHEGRPIYVPSWTPYGGVQPLTTVSQWSVDNAGNSLTHLSGNPYGFLDSVTAVGGGRVRLKGWTFDVSNLGSNLTIHAYFGGQAGQVGVSKANLGAVANAYRPDVNDVFPGVGTNHGFDLTVPSLRSGATTVCLYAINIGTGGDHWLGCKPVTVT